jgi:double-strand break repair protein MRE11
MSRRDTSSRKRTRKAAPLVAVAEEDDIGLVEGEMNKVRDQDDDQNYLNEEPQVTAPPADIEPHLTQWTCSQAVPSSPGPRKRASESKSKSKSQIDDAIVDDDDVDDANEDDTFRIMLATDTHLGFMEQSVERGKDSFLAFEEILQAAKEHRADMVLLGGDLFHHNKPSRYTMFKCVELLRRYTLGDDPIQFEVTSDQRRNFPTNAGQTVNYLDPNYNVSMPVFSVHGNHDDPTGEGSLASIDVLSAANLINHFGKSSTVDDITVYPVLLRKGRTRLAIYGMGHIRDERLHRVFVAKKVRYERPVGDDDWFNMFVLHQNRVGHQAKNSIHECFLERWMDLILWGHEHECLIQPVKSAVADFFIVQPGSSVATSLIEGEAKPKHVGMLEVCGQQFRVRPIPLKTVRPFIIDDIALSAHDELDPNDADAIEEFLAKRIDELVERAAHEHPSQRPVRPDLPLIRLRVDYTGGYQTPHPPRFGQRFVEKVANPESILLFQRVKVQPKRANGKGQADAKSSSSSPSSASVGATTSAAGQDPAAVAELIKDFLDSAMGAKPELLLADDFNTALAAFVDKEDPAAFRTALAASLARTREFILSADDKDTLEKMLDPKQLHELIVEHTAQLSLSVKDDWSSDDNDDNDSDDDDDDDVKGKGKSKSKSKSKSSFVVSGNDDDVDDSDDEVLPKRNLTKRCRGASSSSSSSSSSASIQLAVQISDDDNDNDDSDSDSGTSKKSSASSSSSSLIGLVDDSQPSSVPAELRSSRTKRWGRRAN